MWTFISEVHVRSLPLLGVVGTNVNGPNSEVGLWTAGYSYDLLLPLLGEVRLQGNLCFWSHGRMHLPREFLWAFDCETTGGGWHVARQSFPWWMVIDQWTCDPRCWLSPGYPGMNMILVGLWREAQQETT